MPDVKFVLNGKAVDASYEPGMHFLEVLREECGITSAKNGCAPEGACGCCVVLDNGRPVLSCLRKPEQMGGHEITTMEGVEEDLRRVLGDAFAREGAVQCGFCIPGIVMRASLLVKQGKAGDREEVAKALVGHICRCTGWTRILDAIQTAGEAWKNGKRVEHGLARRHDYFGEQYGLTRTTTAGKGTGSNGSSNGVGASPVRYGGIDQAMGSKPFVDDMHVPDMLNAAPVLTEHPRAKFLGIDTSAAENMPGVVRIFTAKDVPGQRGTGLAMPDLPVFVAIGETTCCIGDMFALVVADTMFHAREAAKKVKIDYEVLEPVTDPFEALKPGAPQVHCEGNLDVRPNLLDPVTAFQARRCGCGAGNGRARGGSGVPDAGRRPRVSRARSVPRRSAGQGRQGLFAEPGLDLRSRPDREGFEHLERGRRGRTHLERRIVRSERRADDSGADARSRRMCCNGR